jgi:hypothetical protein
MDQNIAPGAQRRPKLDAGGLPPLLEPRIRR